MGWWRLRSVWMTNKMVKFPTSAIRYMAQKAKPIQRWMFSRPGIPRSRKEEGWSCVSLERDISLVISYECVHCRCVLTHIGRYQSVTTMFKGPANKEDTLTVYLIMDNLINRFVFRISEIFLVKLLSLEFSYRKLNFITLNIFYNAFYLLYARSLFTVCIHLCMCLFTYICYIYIYTHTCIFTHIIKG